MYVYNMDVLSFCNPLTLDRDGNGKPVICYDIVIYYRKAACPDLFAAWPNALTIFVMKYTVKIVWQSCTLGRTEL